MFDPTTSDIIARLEEGKKTLQELAQQTQIAKEEILDRLDYLIEHHFIIKEVIEEHDNDNDSSNIVISANAEKFDSIMKNDERFDGVIDGLTKMDSYLN